MKELNVETKLKDYPIYIGKDFSELNGYLKDSGYENKKLLIVTDSNVSKLYLDEIISIIKETSSEVNSFIFEAGEKQKNLETIISIYNACREYELDRGSAIIGLGGGVVGDMAGFVAATFMRGIGFIQLPTSLLSQVDSSVGGKTGVDFIGDKNLIGAFYQPDFVYINVDTLNTLDNKEFSSGMGEIIKHGLILDKDYYKYIKDNKKKISEKDLDTMINLVYGSCKIKADIVSKDEREEGIREYLNFGHTLGHAIESLSDFNITHGICVGLGMIGALELSKDYGNINSDDIRDIKELLNYFNMPLEIKDMDFSKEDIYNQMFRDKKVRNNELKFIILEDIGKAKSITNIKEEKIKKVMDKLIKE